MKNKYIIVCLLLIIGGLVFAYFTKNDKNTIYKYQCSYIEKYIDDNDNQIELERKIIIERNYEGVVTKYYDGYEKKYSSEDYNILLDNLRKNNEKYEERGNNKLFIYTDMLAAADNIDNELWYKGIIKNAEDTGYTCNQL